MTSRDFDQFFTPPPYVTFRHKYSNPPTKMTSQIADPPQTQKSHITNSYFNMYYITFKSHFSMYFILHSTAQIPSPIKKAVHKNNTCFQLILFSLCNIISFNLPLIILSRQGKMLTHGINGESLIIINQLFLIHPIYTLSIFYVRDYDN